MGKQRDDRAAPVCVALLAPGLSVLPGLLSRVAGSAGWISVVLALPALLLLGRLVRGQSGTGLAEWIGRKSVWSGVYTFIYIMCAVPLLAVRLGVGARRLASTGQEGIAWWVFVLLLLLSALCVGRGSGAAFLRAAAVVWHVLLWAVVGVCLLAGFRLRGEFLWPVWVEDIPGVLNGAVYALGVFGIGIYGVFLPGEEGRESLSWLWVGVGAQALAVLCVTGCLGADLAGRLTDPWLTLARGVGVRGTVRRLESLVSALWLLADVAYLGLVIHGVRRLSARWLGKRERWSVLLLGAAGVLALTLLRDEGVARRAQERLVPAVGLLIGGVLPLLFRGISCAKSKRKRHI